jgi:hypothetical protein
MGKVPTALAEEGSLYQGIVDDRKGAQEKKGQLISDT